MKNLFLTLFLMVTAMTTAQNDKIVPQISVSGEGKIKVTPDQAIISVGVQNTGKDAIEVKRLNDESVDKVIKFLKKMNLLATDYQTQQVSLYRNYDYEKKKHNYIANQTITIRLKDLKKYDELMMGLLDSGINNIGGVEFKSSKIAIHESEARIKAMENALQKANDYVSILSQKMGKALTISDNSYTNYPVPMYANTRMLKDTAMMDHAAPQETLAIGEIEIVSTVSVSFMLLDK